MFRRAFLDLEFHRLMGDEFVLHIAVPAMLTPFPRLDFGDDLAAEVTGYYPSLDVNEILQRRIRLVHGYGYS